MLKKMSVALLAASILAAPAFAAGPAKTDTSAKSTQTTGTATSGIAKSDAAKTIKGTSVSDKSNEMKPTVGKSKAKPHASLLRHKHRHYAHRHHNKVKALHASVKTPGKVSFNATGHKKMSLKRSTPATRRG